jgi:beta-lactamase regulating signal transducer with metallopeptidase domain
VTDWLIGTLLATSGLILLVLLVREPVRRHFGARVAYGLWLIPATRLLMPTLTETVERPMAAAVTPRMMLSHYTAEPLLLSSVAPPQQSLVERAGGWPAILLVLWLGVALGLFAARMLAFRRERAAILSNATEIGRIGSIRIVRSRDVSGPLAFGIFDRVIAVPADFEKLFAEHERRLALEHELAHHRSGDLIANLLAFGLLCLQWFNPLAWAAHAAFRFDQEAACDARVLDRTDTQDRSEYGRAIAKAASGRALLFASALDRRSTLQRRLKSMLSNPTAGRRLTGRMIVVAGIAVALPLTASRAIHYVDLPAPAAPRTVSAALAPVAAVQAVPAVQPVPAVAPAAPVHRQSISIDDDNVIIDGERRKWSDMTPAEKAEVRRSMAQAKEELSRINHGEIQRQVREAMEGARINREQALREMANARQEVALAMREIDAHKGELRRAGQDPEKIKATVRASLKSVESIDVDAITRQAMESVDPAQIQAALTAAQEGMRKAESELNRLEALDKGN